MQPGQGAQQQAGADEQHERERHLTDDERIAHPRLTTAAAASPPRFAQHAFEIGPGRLRGRRDAKADAGDERNRNVEREDRAFERSAAGARDGCRRGGQEHASDEWSDDESSDCAAK